tara:strand:- start:2752 stop:2922 length:171 start_codon:yes stop_codon:yes gene_type:complete
LPASFSIWKQSGRLVQIRLKTEMPSIGALLTKLQPKREIRIDIAHVRSAICRESAA